MKITNPGLPVHITPLLVRHAEDAAFYWSQLDRSGHSRHIGLEKYADFNSLLDAHLEGLAIAGEDALPSVLRALARWGGAGEVFVCVWLAVHANRSDAMDSLWPRLQKQPEFSLRGMISALAWLPRSLGLPVIAQLSAANRDPLAQVAALRAAALIGRAADGALAQPPDAYLLSQNPHVRAAVCRVIAAGAHAGASTLALLREAKQDDAPAVQVEVALAQFMHDRAEPLLAAAVLWQAVLGQSALHRQAKGRHRAQAARRLTRWLRHLSWLVPPGHQSITELLVAIPPRAALTFVLYHADSAHLPFVTACMERPDVCRYAGWVWQTLTGCDLLADGLTLPSEIGETGQGSQPEPQGLQKRRLVRQHEGDEGLPLPDGDAIRSHAANAALANAGRILLGKNLSTRHGLIILNDAPQALRGVVANAFAHAFPGERVRICSPFDQQRTMMNILCAKIS